MLFPEPRRPRFGNGERERVGYCRKLLSFRMRHTDCTHKYRHTCTQTEAHIHAHMQMYLKTNATHTQIVVSREVGKRGLKWAFVCVCSVCVCV